jgi:hypothetical protein
MEEKQSKWQPILLIVEHRMECECGALAIFVRLDDEIHEDGKHNFKYTAWCQDCFMKAQEEVEFS